MVGQTQRPWVRQNPSSSTLTTMHALYINALLTMIAINKLADRKRTQFFFSPQCKNDQCGSKNTHAAVPEKLTINFFWPYELCPLVLQIMMF